MLIETCKVDFLRRVSLKDTSPFLLQDNLKCSFMDRVLAEINTGNNASHKLFAEAESLNDPVFFRELFQCDDVLKARSKENDLFICAVIRRKSADFINNFITSNLNQINVKEVFSAACECNNERLVNTILSRQVPIDANIVFSVLKGGQSDLIWKILKRCKCLSDEKEKSKQKEDIETNILQEICLSGQLEVLRQYISSMDVEATSLVNGNDLLYFGILSQNLDIVQFCVENSADVKKQFGKLKESALHIACTEENIAIIKYLLDISTKLLYTADSSKYTPLFNAVKANNVDIVAYLIKKGADAMATGQNGDTVLHLACFKGKRDVAFYILKHFPQLLSICSDDGFSVAHYAAFGGSIALLDHVIGLGISVDILPDTKRNILHTACTGIGNEEIVKHLTRNYPLMKEQLDIYGRSALHMAVIGGSEQVIEHLISEGLDVSQCTNKGANILHLACKRAPTETRLHFVQYLMKHFHFLLNARNKLGSSSIHYAAEGGSVELLEYLLGIGFNILDKTDQGLTVLHFACTKSVNEDMVKHLTKKYPTLKHHLAVNGESALHFAVLSGSIPIMTHLMSEGLDVYQLTNSGSNVLHLAFEIAPSNKRLSIVQYFIKHYPSLQHARDNNGNTEIHNAAFGGSVELLEYLLGIGYDIHDRGANGHTALHSACSKPDNIEMVTYLTNKYDLLHILNANGVSALHVAGESGSIPIIDHLISEGLDVNQCDNDGHNLLHFACQIAPTGKRLMIVQYLIRNSNCLQHVRDNEGKTELHLAALGGSVEVLQYFVENEKRKGKRYDIYDTASKGFTILHFACRQPDNIEMVKYLTTNYPGLNNQLSVDGVSALYAAVLGGSTDMIEHLISEWFDVNLCANGGSNILHLACELSPIDKRMSLVQYLINGYPSLQHIHGRLGMTELHFAVLGGSVDLLEYLLETGYDIYSTADNNLTVLHVACSETKDDEMVKHLTKKYPELKFQLTIEGESALHVAMIKGSIPIIEHLVSEGLDIYQCTNYKNNILHLACHLARRDRSLQLVKYLIKRFPLLQRIRGANGMTELHFAVLGGSIKLLNYLINTGYDIYDKASKEYTVLHIACLEGNDMEIVRHLTKKFPELKRQLTVDGESALHLAVHKGCIPIIEHLISEGMDPHERTNDGNNALHLVDLAPPDMKHELASYLTRRFPSLGDE